MKKVFFRLFPANSHIPERGISKVIGLSHVPEYHDMLCGPRPVRLLNPPLPILAIGLLPDHPPRQIRWGNITLNIIKADGPERIEAEWWHLTKNEARDYFRLEDNEGRRVWVFRQGTPPRWFLHGVFA